MIAHDEIAQELDAISQWSVALEQLHAHIARRFARSEVRERVKRYLAGLLGRVERKNGWQLAEAIGETDPQGVQRLLNSARWDAGLLRDDLREYVVEHLSDEQSGVLIVDETGFLKKGHNSVGVARQYTGTAGETVNCQVGVFMAYSSIKGTALIDRALYLPEEEWVNDPKRRAEAGVPEEVAFASKIELAKEMLQRAFEAGVAARWVLADSFYGRSHEFREWLEKRGQAYAVMVPKSNKVDLGGRKKKIEHLAQQLPEDAWWEVLPVEDSSEKRPWQWACLELAADPQQQAMSRWLLVRRDSEDPDEDLDFYQAYGPEDTSVEELLGACQERWAIEFAFEEAKGEIGMDHYEVRKWGAWHRYVTLCLLAHAFLVVTRLAARNKEVACKKGVVSLA